MLYLAADVGGTFTDLVLVDIDADLGAARIFLDKVSSRATGSADGLAQGIMRLAQQAGIEPGSIDLFVHGFTVGTNAFLTRSGAKVVFVTTEGFRDLLVIGDQQRPALYALSGAKPAPVVPRSRAIEVPERIDAFGNVVASLGQSVAEKSAAAVAALSPDSVAISLLFAHLNPVHEQMLEASLRHRLNGVPIYLSSRVNPEIEEYPRASTTAIAAYVGPVIERYLDAVEGKLRAIGLGAPLRLMRSDGGSATVRGAKQNPAHMLLSGPAGGVIAGAALARDLGIDSLITFDMGGTSADFSVVHNGQATTVGARKIDGHPLRLAALDIETISAGGGSIATIDLAGGLKVGPRSAGADPGPACYDMGDTEATITDACVVLGILDPSEFLGGDIPLNAQLARQVIADTIARPLGLEVEAAAHGIISVACANMCQAIRTLSVERGYDVRGFSLLAFGGAGPIHAAFMARDLGMMEVVVPRHPGVFAASGLLMTDLRHTMQKPWSVRLDHLAQEDMERHLTAMRRELEGELERDGVRKEDRYFKVSADLRCVGQFHVLTLRLPAPWDISDGTEWWDVNAVVRAFHGAHERAYGHSEASVPVEIVNLRAEGFGKIAKPVEPARRTPTNTTPRPVGRRKVFLDPSMGWVETDLYRRDDLELGHELAGPAIVSQRDSTVLVLPGQTAKVDLGGSMRIRVGTAEQ